MRRWTTAAAATSVVALVGWLAAAADHSRHTTALEPATAPGTAPHASGMVISVDPETGELGMPARAMLGQELSIEEAQAYARQIRSELVTINNSDGSQTLIHDERLADYAVIRIAPDGQQTFLCVHGEQAAHNACGAAPVQPGLEEK